MRKETGQNHCLWHAYRWEPSMVVLWEAYQQLTETETDTYTQPLDWSWGPLWLNYGKEGDPVGREAVSTHLNPRELPETKPPTRSIPVLVWGPLHLCSWGLSGLALVVDDAFNPQEPWGPRERGGLVGWRMPSQRQGGGGMGWGTVGGGTGRGRATTGM